MIGKMLFSNCFVIIYLPAFSLLSKCIFHDLDMVLVQTNNLACFLRVTSLLHFERNPSAVDWSFRLYRT